MNTNNPLTEVGTLIIAALLIIGGVTLLYVSKIDTAFATSMFILAAGLLGITGALKAPSQAQQAQIGALAERQQTLTSQVLSALPAVASATQPQPVAPAPTEAPRVSAQQLLAQPLPPEYFTPPQAPMPPPITIAAATPWTGTATSTVIPQAAESPFLTRTPQFQPVPFPSRTNDTAGFPVPQ